MNQKEKIVEATIKALRNQLNESENIQNRSLNLMLRNPEKYGEKLQSNGYTVTINGQKFTRKLMDKAKEEGNYEIQISKNNKSNKQHSATYIIKYSDGKMYVSSWDDLYGRSEEEVANKGQYDFVGLLDKRPDRDKAYDDFVNWYYDQSEMANELNEPELDYSDLVQDFRNVNIKPTTDVKQYQYNKKLLDTLSKQINDLQNKIEKLYKDNIDGSNDEAIEDAESDLADLQNTYDEYKNSINDIFIKHRK